MNTKEDPLIADFSESFGYVVHYWPSPSNTYVTHSDEEVLVVDFEVHRAHAAPHEKDLRECTFSIKWDGCLNLSTPDFAMHFCSQEGVRAFAAVLVKCFDLAAKLMPMHAEEFLEDGGYDDVVVLGALLGMKTRTS